MARLREGITIKQKRLVDITLETGNQTEAGMQAYNCQDRNSARSLASRELAKDNVREYIKQMSGKSVNNMSELSNQRENLSVAFQANKDILDRAGYKPIERTHSMRINVNIKPDKDTLKLKEEYEAKLKQLLSQ